MNYDFSNFPIDLILNILNIVILFVIVRFLVYKPVKKFMDARTARVTAAAEDAGAKAKAAEELSEQLRAQLADAANDADRIRNEAAAAAKAQADNVLKEAGEQADRIVSEAKERAEAEREEVLSSLRSDIASSAEAIAGKILERKVSDEDTKRIAEEFFREAESGGVAKIFPVFSIKLYPRFYPFFAQGPVFQVVCVVAVYSENAKKTRKQQISIKAYE